MDRKHTLVDNTAEQRYEFDLEGAKAFIEYLPGNGLLILTHTEVPSQFKGQGIGKELVRAALEDIRKKGLHVVPQCTFVAQYIRNNPEWEELVVRETTTRQ